jgi:biotin carboxyl carrier protein
MKIRVKIENEIYDVEVGDLSTRPILATVGGETFEIYPEEAEARADAAVLAATPQPIRPVYTPSPVPAADCKPPSSSARSAERSVTAPIPGVILSIAVKAGDQVQYGQELCVLEAMKMKNAIRANRAGKIAAIHITNGDTVSHGQPLMDFSD